MKIGIFDSGVGGLTVLKRLSEIHKQHHYIYYGDSLNLPYGSKTKEELLSLAKANIEFLLEKGAEVIVIACGTVSSNIDDDFKAQYKIPIIDIVEPTVKYINNSDFKTIGILATDMTIKSKSFVKKIRQEIEVTDVACPLFVPLIEEGQIESNEMKKAMDLYLKDIKEADAILLGCTHYPLIKNNIISHIKKEIEVIDVGYIIANDFNFKKSDYSKIDIYYSKKTQKIIENTCLILGNFQIKGD